MQLKSAEKRRIEQWQLMINQNAKIKKDSSSSAARIAEIEAKFASITILGS